MDTSCQKKRIESVLSDSKPPVDIPKWALSSSYMEEFNEIDTPCATNIASHEPSLTPSTDLTPSRRNSRKNMISKPRILSWKPPDAVLNSDSSESTSGSDSSSCDSGSDE